MLTQHYMSLLVRKIGGEYRFMYNVVLTVTYQVNLSSKFQSSMPTFNNKLLAGEGTVLATRPSSMTILVNLFINNVIQTITIVT